MKANKQTDGLGKYMKKLNFNPVRADQLVCKHPDFWFDRVLSKCGPHCEGEQMHDCCVECGITNCQLNNPPGKR